MSAATSSATSAIKRTVCDWICIGAGSGSLEASWNLATEYKKTVCVIDCQKEHGPPHYSGLAGTCVNIGCVPKKLFVIGAGFREVYRDAKGFGYDIESNAVPHNWTKLLEAKNRTISNINKSYLEMFNDTPGMSYHVGWGRFTADKNIIEVVDSTDGTTVNEIIEAKSGVLIATGSWPTFPDTPGLKEYSISSNEFFYMKELPKRVLFVGGGFIACEFANVLRSFCEPDAQVTLSYRGKLFLRGFDQDVRECVADQMRHRGIDVRFNSNIERVELGADGKSRIVTFMEGKVETYDTIITATGRTPNTHRLQCGKIGLELDDSGAIPVDKYNKTKVDNVYAIGDVTNRIMLTPVAIHEAQCFADTVNGKPRAIDHENVPSAIFTIPQIGTCGLIEEEAAKKYKTVAVYMTKSTPLMHQLTGNEWKRYVLKLITDHSNGKVIGCHICSPEAGEMIQGFAVAMKAGATIKDFNATIGVHPTTAEDMCSMKTPEYYFVDGKKVDKLTSSL